MMGHKQILKSGDEMDVVAARHILKVTERPGICRRVKRKLSRRERQDAKAEIRRAG